MATQKLELSEDIIDYSFDDFLYVLTKRYLWKIDSQFLVIIDRIPLPEKFNYLSVGEQDIFLITTEEIIVLDKSHFSFKSGIGIEPGDYKPIFLPGNGGLIYLIADTEKKSILKILDLKNGRLVKRLTVPRVLSYEYHKKSKTLITLDINNQINSYDFGLKRKGQIKLKFNSESFRRQDSGYIVYSQQGVFRVDDKGTVIDFQPLQIDRNSFFIKDLFLTEQKIVLLDLLTVRIRWFYADNKEIIKLVRLDDLYNIALNARNELYLIDTDSLQVKPLAIKKVSPQEIVSSLSNSDSLWYLQLGAFSSYENASTVYADLKQAGLPVFVDSVDLYRIKLGGFVDKASACEINQRLGIGGWLVFQEKIERKETGEFFIAEEKYLIKDGIIRKE